MVSGLLCWRDSHPLEWQLASLNGVAGFAAGGSSSERKRSRPIRAFSATPRDGQRPCRTLAEDPGRTQPRAAYPGAAAQTRVVSVAAIRLGSWESARAFKGKFATTFLSSNLTCPARQSGLCRMQPVVNL